MTQLQGLACTEDSHVWTVDYNSWIESDKGRKLANSLDKDIVLAEG